MKQYIVRNGPVIIRYGMCQSSDMQLQATGNEVVSENTGNWNNSEHYYDGTSYVARPAFALVPTALIFTTAESITVTGIPVGTTVHFPGGSEAVDDGEIEWNSIVAGKFSLRFENFPYIEEVIDVEVTDI